MRTPIAIEAKPPLSDGSPASGWLCARPNTTAILGDDYFPADDVCGFFDDAGRLVAQRLGPFVLLASDDAGIAPVVIYTFTLFLDGQSVFEWQATVPHAPDVAVDESNGSTPDASDLHTVLLSDLVASNTMVGATVAGTGIGGSTTITAVDEIANTITLAAAVGADYASGMVLTIAGAVIPLTALMQESVSG
jgi:hypothetical protein